MSKAQAVGGDQNCSIGESPMKSPKLALIVITTLFLSACQTNGVGPKQQFGTLAGAGLGALAGANMGKGRGRLATVALGALGGAYLGSEIGRSLDRADRRRARRAYARAMSAPVGQRIAWNNPNSRNFGSYETPREGRDRASGAYCREYKSTINVGGWDEYSVGTACRQPDGTWRIIS